MTPRLLKDWVVAENLKAAVEAVKKLRDTVCDDEIVALWFFGPSFCRTPLDFTQMLAVLAC